MSPAWLHVPVLLFALSTVPGAMVAYDPSLSLRALLAIWLGAALYFSVALLPRSERAHRAVAIALLSTCAIFAIYIITQYGYLGYDKGGFVVRLGQLTTVLPDLGGLRPNANAAAAFLEGSIPVGVALALSCRRTAPRIVLAAVTAIIAYAVFLTASRGAWLAMGFAAVLSAFVFVAIPRLRRLSGGTPRGVAALSLAALLSSLALGAPALFLEAQALPVNQSALSSTLDRAADRLTLYQNSLYLARDYLFTGAGLGDTFGMIYSRYGLLIHVPFLYYPHNLPLSVWFNQGLLGLIALAGISMSLALLAARLSQFMHLSPIFHGTWLGAIVILLHGLTDAPQYDPASPWAMPVLFVLLGIVASAARLVPAALPPSGRRPRARVVVAIIAVAGAMLVASQNELMSAWHTNVGALAETRCDLSPSSPATELAAFCPQSETEYRDALSHDPSYAPAQRRLGNLLVRLERFEEAVPLLEQALLSEPGNPASVKGLGLAYSWVGRTGEAAPLLGRVGAPTDLESELPYWAFYWSERERPLLSAYALEVLSAVRPATITPKRLTQTADYFRAAGQTVAARAYYQRAAELQPVDQHAVPDVKDPRP